MQRQRHALSSAHHQPRQRTAGSTLPMQQQQQQQQEWSCPGGAAGGGCRAAPRGLCGGGRRRGGTAGAVAEAVQLADLVSGDGLDQFLYDAGLAADTLVTQQLAGLTPVTYLTVLLAGLATSLSPCTLSVLPLTIGYIGGYGGGTGGGTAAADAGGTAGDAGGGTGGGTAKPSPLVQAASFSLGLASTLSALGLLSTALGAAYGTIGDGLPLAVAVVAIVMGLNLLELLPLRLPSLDVDTRALPLPPPARAYIAGLTFALAASPCSSPVLATLLAFVSSSEASPLQGAALLLLYSLGYVAPLLVAATFTGALKQLLSLRQYSAWITPASGGLLVAGGSYAIVTRLLPYVS